MTALPARQPEALSSASIATGPSRHAGIIADPYIPGLAWIPVDLAAKALGLSERAMRMKGESLKAAGMAKQLAPAIGGQLRWHFSSRFDARLAEMAVSPVEYSTDRTPGTSHSVTDAFERFRAAPAHRQRAAVAKVIAVKAYRDWRRAPTTRISDPVHQAALMRTISAQGGTVPGGNNIRRLYEWNELVADLNLSDAAQYQAACWELLDRRGGNTADSHHGEAWDIFQAAYLRDNKLSIRQCWEIAGAEARKRGLTWVSLSRAKQLVHERLPASVRTLAREGEESWQRDYLPPIVQDQDAWEAGQCWESDHTRCDFFVQTVRGGNVVAERPWITAFLDRRSRRLMGWSMGFEANSDSIRAALHDALSREDTSVPEVVVLDNGKDFASQEFAGLTKAQRRKDEQPEWSGLFGMLGIALHFATPYNHNGKARIERFFGVVHQGFDRTLDSWSGSGPDERDQDKIKSLLDAPLTLPTLDEVRERFRGWAEHYNHNAERNVEALVAEDGKRLSPAEWYATRLPGLRTMPNKRRVLTMLEQRWSRPVTVTKFGVSIKIAGRTLSYGQHDPRLTDLVGSGKKVHVTFNPADLNAVRVYDERFALVCEAPMNTRHGGPTETPLAKRDLHAAIARQRQHRRDIKRQVDIAAAVLPIADLARIEEREREVATTKARMQADGVENPPPMRLVNAPISGSASDDDASSVPLRKAAGAECDEFPFDIQRLLNDASSVGEEAEANDDTGSFSLLEAMSAQDADGATAADDSIGFDILRELGA